MVRPAFILPGACEIRTGSGIRNCENSLHAAGVLVLFVVFEPFLGMPLDTPRPHVFFRDVVPHVGTTCI